MNASGCKCRPTLSRELKRWCPLVLRRPCGVHRQVSHFPAVEFGGCGQRASSSLMMVDASHRPGGVAIQFCALAVLPLVVIVVGTAALAVSRRLRLPFVMGVAGCVARGRGRERERERESERVRERERERERERGSTSRLAKRGCVKKFRGNSPRTQAPLTVRTHTYRCALSALMRTGLSLALGVLPLLCAASSHDV